MMLVNDEDEQIKSAIFEHEAATAEVLGGMGLSVSSAFGHIRDSR